MHHCARDKLEQGQQGENKAMPMHLMMSLSVVVEPADICNLDVPEHAAHVAGPGEDLVVVDGAAAQDITSNSHRVRLALRQGCFH